MKTRNHAALDFLSLIAGYNTENKEYEELLESPSLLLSDVFVKDEKMVAENESLRNSIRKEDSVVVQNKSRLLQAFQSWRSDEDLDKKRNSVITTQRSTRTSDASIQDLLVVFTYPSGPVSLFSLLPLKENLKFNSIPKNRIGKKPLKSPYFTPYFGGLPSLAFNSVKSKKVTESYGLLLEPQWVFNSIPLQEQLSLYDPYYLDHPDLKSGKNKTVMTLPGFLGTILLPLTANEIKKELNLHFREAHPDLNEITLSSIRSLKSSLSKVGVNLNLEISSIAFSHVYFEKLILKNFVDKSNRNLIACICLLLAVKVNDSKDINYGNLLRV